jgi:hypothetical protein
MTFGQISYGKYRQRARILRNLKIDSVDSVDRGAAGSPGSALAARVMLTKRYGTPSATAVREWDGVGTPPGADRGYRYIQKKDHTPMREQHNLVRVAKGLGQAVEKGLDQEAFSRLANELADEMFPNDPHALSKLVNSKVGGEMFAKAAQKHYENLQFGSACGDGYEAVMKMDKTEPHVRRAQAEPKEHATSDPDGVEEPWDKRVKDLMDKYGMSKDAAISYLHRAEKVAKGF